MVLILAPTEHRCFFLREDKLWEPNFFPNEMEKWQKSKGTGERDRLDAEIASQGMFTLEFQSKAIEICTIFTPAYISRAQKLLSDISGCSTSGVRHQRGRDGQLSPIEDIVEASGSCQDMTVI